jgi:hypothetical protein
MRRRLSRLLSGRVVGQVLLPSRYPHERSFCYAVDTVGFYCQCHQFQPQNRLPTTGTEGTDCSAALFGLAWIASPVLARLLSGRIETRCLRCRRLALRRFGSGTAVDRFARDFDNGWLGIGTAAETRLPAVGGIQPGARYPSPAGAGLLGARLVGELFGGLRRCRDRPARRGGAAVYLLASHQWSHQQSRQRSW